MKKMFLFLCSLFSICNAKLFFVLHPIGMIAGPLFSDGIEYKFDYMYEYSSDRKISVSAEVGRIDDCAIFDIDSKICTDRYERFLVGWVPSWHGIYANPKLYLGHMRHYSEKDNGSIVRKRGVDFGGQLSIGYFVEYKSVILMSDIGVDCGVRGVSTDGNVGIGYSF